jgi:hypothetical protein
LVAACADNALTNPVSDFAGTYQLTVHAGRSAPFTYIVAPDDAIFRNIFSWDTSVGGTLALAGAMVLNSNGAFAETSNYIFTPSAPPVDAWDVGDGVVSRRYVSRGTWTLNGTDLTFSAQAQSGQASRHFVATLIVDASGVPTIRYQESDGAGGFNTYEYKR